MNKKYFWGVLLSMLILASCGSGDDDDNDDPVVTNPPVQEETDNNGDQPNRTIRYSAVVVEGDDSLDYRHNIRMDLNRRPVIITGNVNDAGGNCNFAITLTEAQADKLEARADRLRLCTRDGDIPAEDIAIDGGDWITLTDVQGNTTSGDKYLWTDDDMDQTYICKGRSSFYSYVRQLVRSGAPASCPTGFTKRI